MRELDALKALGVNNLRVLATTQGPDTEPWRVKPATEQWNSATNSSQLNETYMTALDDLIVEAGKREMTVVLMVTNFWFWSGGFAQYVQWHSKPNIPIPYPMNKTDPDATKKYLEYTQDFYKCNNCMKAYDQLAEKIILRKNTVNGVLYKDDVTIMAWELANGPYPGDFPKETTNWIDSACKRIKELDGNHMVAIGNTRITQNNYNESLKLKCIDYATLHIWPENFGWYNPKDNKTFEYAVNNTTDFLKSNVEAIHKQLIEIKDDKPIVVEEFGLARDDRSLQPNSTTQYRDKYFSMLFEAIKGYMDNKQISGANFWGWAGEGRAKNIIWNITDDWIGDPPNEDQGWYSIYDKDSTLNVIRKYTKLFVPSYAIKDHALKWDFWILVCVSAIVVAGGIAIDLIKRTPNKNEEDYLATDND